MLKLIHKYIVNFIILLIISCSSTPGLKSLKIKRSFNYQNISNKSFYILPVINKTDFALLDESDMVIEKYLKEERPKLWFYGSNYTLDRLREYKVYEFYTKAIDEYKSKREVSPEIIKEISAGLKCGYLIFSILDNFKIVKNEYNREEMRSEGGTGKFKMVTVNVYEAKSTLCGTFSVFDLHDGSVAFDVKHEVNLVKSTSQERKDFLTNIFQDIFLRPAVEPYSSVETSEYFYCDIARNFPED